MPPRSTTHLLRCSTLSILCTLSCAKVTKSSCIEEPALLQSCWFWHRILSINIFDCRYEVLTYEKVWVHLASLICFLRPNHVEITDGSMMSKLPMDRIVSILNCEGKRCDMRKCIHSHIADLLLSDPIISKFKIDALSKEFFSFTGHRATKWKTSSD